MVMRSGGAEDGAEASQFAAVGTWDSQLAVYSLPQLQPLAQEALGGENLPRSLLFASFEGLSYLLCALGDGHLLNFRIDPSSGAWGSSRTFIGFWEVVPMVFGKF